MRVTVHVGDASGKAQTEARSTMAPYRQHHKECSKEGISEAYGAFILFEDARAFGSGIRSIARWHDSSDFGALSSVHGAASIWSAYISKSC